MKVSAILFIFTLLISFSSVAKRAEPIHLAPLLAGDYLYTVPHWSWENGTDQNGGYIQVSTAKTGVPAWGIQVYKTEYDSGLEADIQDVFITKIQINICNTVLTVTDELGRVFAIDLHTKKITQLELLIN
jgi:hypothetical protein